MSNDNRKDMETLGMAARRLLRRIDARKASGASKAGVNLDIGCPLVPVPAAEATEGDELGRKAVSPRSQAVGPEVRGQANDDAAPKAMRVPSHRGPPGSEGKSGRGFRNQADAGEVFPMRSPANRRGFEPELFTGGFPYVRASVKG